MPRRAYVRTTFDSNQPSASGRTGISPFELSELGQSFVELGVKGIWLFPTNLTLTILGCTLDVISENTNKHNNYIRIFSLIGSVQKSAQTTCHCNTTCLERDQQSHTVNHEPCNTPWTNIFSVAIFSLCVALLRVDLLMRRTGRGLTSRCGTAFDTVAIFRCELHCILCVTDPTYLSCPNRFSQLRLHLQFLHLSGNWTHT